MHARYADGAGVIRQGPPRPAGSAESALRSRPTAQASCPLRPSPEDRAVPPARAAPLLASETGRIRAIVPHSDLMHNRCSRSDCA